jgi:hypothetical protein
LSRVEQTPYNLDVCSRPKDATARLKNNYRTGTFFCDNLPDVIAKLKELHPGDPKAAVYAYAGMRQEIELDG